MLGKAVVRAARLLGLTQRDVAAALGISEATTSRMFAGKYVLSRERAKEWELAVLLVRLFRSLDALWGHERPRAHVAVERRTSRWAAARPISSQTVEGMVSVVAYLDAARGRI